MGARRILRLAFFILPVCLVYPRLLQPQSNNSARSAAQPDKQTKASPMVREPEGPNRCEVCHSAEVEGYSRSAMAHALRRAGQEPSGTVATPKGKITAYSLPTGSWQRVETAGDVSNFHIDFVIGSGNHASGYITDIAGHLFQSPIAFYKSRNSYDL